MARKRRASRPTNKPSLLDELRANPRRKLTVAERERLVKELHADPVRTAARMAGEWREAFLAREARKVAEREAATASSSGGRRRHPLRDEIVVEVCRHLADRSDWSKLSQGQFAIKLQDDFNNALSTGEIEGIIRLARRLFPRP